MSTTIEINQEALSALSISDLTGLIRHLNDEQLYLMDSKRYVEEIKALKQEVFSRQQDIFIK